MVLEIGAIGVFAEWATREYVEAGEETKDRLGLDGREGGGMVDVT
jgi:hypothetical protein